MKPIIFSLNSTYPSHDEIELFKHCEPIGFILFSRNIESKTQLTTLTTKLRNLYPNKKKLIFVDQEGGRVARIKPPIMSKLYPSASYFSELYESDKALALDGVESNYFNLMRELKLMGIDSPCAPVCDILYPDSNNIVGDRSFGNNVEKVVALCKAAIRSIQHADGIPFIKHMPGHGRATLDSHFDLPMINTKLEELIDTDFKVFKDLAQENVWGMTAHIIYESIDPIFPITISPKGVKYIRNNIGFKGTLISDDICMNALYGEIGTKRSLLTKILNSIHQNKDWRKYSCNQLQKLFGVSVSNISDVDIEKFCNEKMQEIVTDFLTKLQKITNMTLEAGCDAMLHCSGDIKEMKVISSLL